jgi:hypothetical protein
MAPVDARRRSARGAPFATQAAALYALREGPLDDCRALVLLGSGRSRTLHALERAGLARYFPTPEHWKLTRDGRVWLNDEDARRARAEHQATVDAAIGGYRSDGR